MSEQEAQNWAEANQRYLTTAVAWLRLRLERLAQHDHPAVPPKQEPPPRHGLLGGWSESPAPMPAQSSLNEQIAQRAAELDAAETRRDPPMLVVLSRRLGLSRFERDILLLCVAMELDTRIAALCARAQDDLNRPYPTFALALVLFDNPSWDVTSPERPLRHWRLLEINQTAAQQLITSSLRTDERIVSYVKGLNYLDDRLDALMVPLEIDGEHEELPHSQERLVKDIVHQWEHIHSIVPLLQLVGPDIVSKQLVALGAATRLQRRLYRMPIEMLPQQANDIEALARLWHRESLLLPLALYIDAQESDGNTSTEGQVQSLMRFLARCDGFFFLSVRETWSHSGRPGTSFDVERPTTREQQSAWQSVLADEADSIPEQLAGQFSLNVTTIYRLAEEALAKQREQEADEAQEEQQLEHRLWRACRLLTRPKLDTLAQRLDLKATWDDLVLPQEEMATLHQVADQVGQRSKVYEEWGFAEKMNRGLGINALFAGESGTGKTMAAEVIANALHLYLYRIDLSAVVSKYIGETEKNLRRLFDAAENGGAILFFDEADALFGKRSEVKDSHDRYANIEINYLLQRIESYRGLSILATNMKSALDTAFIRRLRFIVTFPFPGLAERRRMWERVFPEKTPKDALDYDRLARLNLTGGSIHNIAINAAFLAAHAGTPVTMALIFQAARAEFRKLERPINEADFRLPSTQGAKA